MFPEGLNRICAWLRAGVCAWLLAGWLVVLPTAAAESISLTVLATTDIHAHVYPYDYLTGRQAQLGLAKAATIINRVRTTTPHTLLVDCGDTVQGTPLAYVAARLRPTEPHPVIAAMNALGYDAMAVGNHEFNFALETLWRLKGEARFPWLAANVSSYYHDTRRDFLPYVIREVGGVRVAILGLVTPAVPCWEVTEHYRGYRFHDLVETARRYLPKLRRRADVVLVLAHSGLGRDPETGEPQPCYPGEDAVWDIAEQVPGIDVIIFGHSHGEVSGLRVNGVLLVQPKNWAQSVAELRITLQRDAPRQPWQVVDKQSRLIPVDESVEADAKILSLARAAHQATERWLNTTVARAPAILDARTARFEDNPLVELVQRAELHYGQAEVALASVFSPWLEIPAGPVTIRQIFALYPSENQLITVELTGTQLRQVLEYSARYFRRYPFPATDSFFTPGVPGYNFVIAGGVSYKLDLSNPVGERIVELKFHRQPLAPGQKLRVALSSYRYAGGGSYEMLRGAKIIRRAKKEIRGLLIDYLLEIGTFTPTVDNNWEILPNSARQTLLDSVRPTPALVQ